MYTLLARKAGIESIYAMVPMYFSCIDSKERVVFKNEVVDYHVNGYLDEVNR